MSVAHLLRPDLIDLPGVAERLDLRSVTHAGRLVSRAGIEAVGEIGRCLVFDRTDIEALADRRRRQIGVRSPKQSEVSQ